MSIVDAPAPGSERPVSSQETSVADRLRVPSDVRILSLIHI